MNALKLVLKLKISFQCIPYGACSIVITLKVKTMFDSLSEEIQLILMVIGIAILFVAVSWNTKRNKRRFYDRNKRNFRKNYMDKKKEKE